MAFIAADDYEPGPERIPSAGEALAEIEDWKRRITDLFDTVRGWVADDPALAVDTARTVRRHEEILRRNGLPPYRMPVLVILRDGTPVLTLRPDERWVLHTRGRVMVVGGNRPARLLDSPQVVREPGWRLVDVSNFARGGEPFTREGLYSLFGDRP